MPTLLVTVALFFFQTKATKRGVVFKAIALALRSIIAIGFK
jgi:Gpi18-like mannosyltransferase